LTQRTGKGNNFWQATDIDKMPSWPSASTGQNARPQIKYDTARYIHVHPKDDGKPP